MNSITHQYSSKFIQDSAGMPGNIVQDLNNIIYKLLNSSIKNVLFDSRSLTKEFIQFITDSRTNNINFTIYHHIIDQNIVDKLAKPNIKHIFHHGTSTNNSAKQIPLSINSELYNEDLKNLTKKNCGISFLDNINTIPESLSVILFPKKVLPIRLFNNKNIPHPQNLGILSLNDRKSLLIEAKYYISFSEYDDYILEAKYAKCIIVSPTEFEKACNNQEYSCQSITFDTNNYHFNIFKEYVIL